MGKTIDAVATVAGAYGALAQLGISRILDMAEKSPRLMSALWEHAWNKRQNGDPTFWDGLVRRFLERGEKNPQFQGWQGEI
jgi:hypothetical protein